MNNTFIHQYALKWDIFLHIYLNGWGGNSANPKDMFGVNHMEWHIYDHFEVKNTVSKKKEIRNAGIVILTHLSVQFSCSVVSSSLRPHGLQHTKAFLSITNSRSLLKLMSIQVGDAIQPSHPLLSPSPSAFTLSQHHGLFKWVSSLQRSWPKYWSVSFSISPSNEYSGLISFRTHLC